MAQSGIYFFIGTEAELIKLFPVMLQLQAQQVPYHIIASGQNDIVKSTILRALNGGGLARASREGTQGGPQ